MFAAFSPPAGFSLSPVARSAPCGTPKARTPYGVLAELTAAGKKSDQHKCRFRILWDSQKLVIRKPGETGVLQVPLTVR
jgi:hypothetical protein